MRKTAGLFAVLIVVFSATGCNEGSGSKSPPTDGSGVLTDAPFASGDGSTRATERGTPVSDRVIGKVDGTIPPPPPPPPPKKDSGAPPPPPPPPAYGAICTATSQCATDQLCVKLASDSYPKGGAPPPSGMCLKKCTNTTAPCTSTATQYYPCIGAYTWDLGSIQVCAIACYTAFGGTVKTYACPSKTYCTRSIGTFMKVCTPYQ